MAKGLHGHRAKKCAAVIKTCGKGTQVGLHHCHLCTATSCSPLFQSINRTTKSDHSEPTRKTSWCCPTPQCCLLIRRESREDTQLPGCEHFSGVWKVRLRVEHKLLNVSAPGRAKLKALENSHQTLQVTILRLLSKSHLKLSFLSNQWIISRRKEFSNA